MFSEKLYNLMSDWESVFDIWEDFSPFLHRNLMSRKELWEWIEKLGYTIFSSEENVMDILMDYLEEIDLFRPIHIDKKGSKFGQKQMENRGIIYFQKPSEEEMNEILKYYHPFQFFQFILYWDCYKNNFTKESRFYYYLRKGKVKLYEMNEVQKKNLLLKIEKEEKKWIKNTNKDLFKGFNKNVDRSKERKRRDKNQQKKKNSRRLKEVNEQKKAHLDFFYPKLIHSYWLTPDYLKIWIKLDSLSLFREYIITPSGISVQPLLICQSLYDKKERNEVLINYNNWRDNLMKDKRNFLTEDEQKILKQLYSSIYEDFIHSSKNRVNGLEKWEDLIDMMPQDKLSKLYGNLNISVNILSIMRYLTRVAWELFEYNLIPWPRNKENERPYYCLNEEKDVIEFRRSVLADFGLFVSSPFILYVEGETEKQIISSYFQIKRLWFPITVENIKGIDKTIQNLTIAKSIKERNYYFFLDYERSQKYKEKKKLVGNNGAFFFPDFVTENFKPEEILELFAKWFYKIGVTLTKRDRKGLSKELNECKTESSLLIQMEEKEGNPKSYEKVLVNFSIRNYPNFLIKAYPEIMIDENPQYPSKMKFKQKFKKIFTENYIILLIKNALETDPERKGDKFAFETKLSPFYTSINQYIHRNVIIRYDLEL